MKIVKFKNGKYGIRKFSRLKLGYVYLDLKDNQCWWSRESRWFLDCQDSLEKTKKVFDDPASGYKDVGTPI